MHIILITLFPVTAYFVLYQYQYQVLHQKFCECAVYQSTFGFTQM